MNLRLKPILLTAVLQVVCLFSISANAFNLLFLKDAPVAEFDLVDTGLMVENFYHAMNAGEDGVVSEWKNMDTGHSGSVKLIKTVSNDEKTCREVEVSNSTKDNSALSQLLFCKVNGGKWEIAE